MKNLETIYYSRSSFYGKAKVEVLENRINLYSYETLVAYIENGATPHVNGDYTQTTLRHIKEFLLQNGFVAINKKQMMEDYAV